jgi:2-dehydro-3-deoxyglucarate aldolase
MLVAQIETQAGVENREEILSVGGIDAFLVGLAMSMGHAGEVNHPAVQSAAELVLTTCRERDQLFTIPLRASDDIDRGQGLGVKMLTISSDGGLLAAGARQFFHRIKERESER